MPSCELSIVDRPRKRQPFGYGRCGCFQLANSSGALQIRSPPRWTNTVTILLYQLLLPFPSTPCQAITSPDFNHMATQSTLRPHSIAELADAAEDSIQFNSRYSARSWIRAADSLHKQAASYQLILESHDGGEANERAFMSWIRVAKSVQYISSSSPSLNTLSFHNPQRPGRTSTDCH